MVYAFSLLSMFIKYLRPDFKYLSALLMRDTAEFSRRCRLIILASEPRRLERYWFVMIQIMFLLWAQRPGLGNVRSANPIPPRGFAPVIYMLSFSLLVALFQQFHLENVIVPCDGCLSHLPWDRANISHVEAITPRDA